MKWQNSVIKLKSYSKKKMEDNVDFVESWTFKMF